MALAILEFVSYEKENAIFKIDIGTNNFYKLKVGKDQRSNEGVNWIDEISFSTQLLQKKGSSNDLLYPGEEIKIPSKKI